MAEKLNDKRIDHLFSADIDLSPWGFYPSVSGGVRVNSAVQGGTVFGPNGLTGEVVPGGESNMLLRYNGVFELEGRITVRLSDETLVYLPYDGRADFCAPEDVAVFASGRNNSSLNVYLAVYPESTDTRIDKQFVFAVGEVDNVSSPTVLKVDFYEFECLPIVD